MDAQERMIEARRTLIYKHRFFAVLAMSLKMEVDNTCKTAWTDGFSIGFNPDFIGSLKDKIVRFILLHELAHVFLRHHLRRENRDFDVWNKACDYAANLLLVGYTCRVNNHPFSYNSGSGISLLYLNR